MPVVWARSRVGTDERPRCTRHVSIERDADDDMHDTPPMNHADAARRSKPASKPYSRNIAATRSLSMGVFV